MSNTSVLGGRNPGFGSGDMKQILEALRALKGDSSVSVITLMADPETTATAASIGTLGQYNGHLYLHTTGAADTNWLDVTVLESEKEEIATICIDDGAALHTLAGVEAELSAILAFDGSVERGVDSPGWSFAGGAGNVLPVFSDVNSNRWSRRAGCVSCTYEGRNNAGSTAAGTGTLSIQLPRPASAGALPVIVPVGLLSTHSGQMQLFGRIDPTSTNLVLYKLVGGTLSFLTGADLASTPEPLYVFLQFSYECDV